MGFTPAELAEMALADAEIEASFCISNEEIRNSREMDRSVVLDQMEPKKRKIAEAQRQYREANKAKIAEGKRQYREANKAKIAEAQRQYREANKAKIAEGKRAIRELRKSLGMSQKQFGAMLGVTQVTVSNWERINAPENWQEICETYAPG